MKTFTILIEQGEDGYLLSEVVELPGCRTQAKTKEELLKRTKEAILLYLESDEKFEIKTKFLGIESLEVEV